LPNDASDNGAAPSPDEICELRLTVGDWSSSNSERYDLKVGPVTHQAPQFGVVKSESYKQFRPGKRYEVRIIHRGTDPDKWFYPKADYDYVAQIEQVSLPSGVVMVIDDPDGILGTHGEPNTPNGIFDAAGKVAYVNLIKASFIKDSDQKYGFDDYTGGKDCVHKSVRVSYTEPIKAVINPAEKADKIYFTSADTGMLTVSPSQASGSPETLTLTGISESLISNVTVSAKYDSPSGPWCGFFHARTYVQDEYSLAIRTVHEENDDAQVIPVGGGELNEPNQICVSAGANGFRDTPDSAIGGDDQISGNDITTGSNGICETAANGTNILSGHCNPGMDDFLNNYIYNQAVVRWEPVDYLSDMTVNFDLNRNGKLDIDTSEQTVIQGICNDPNYDYVVFFVKSSDREWQGSAQRNQRYAYVYTDYSVENGHTTAHELGHAAFGLYDKTTGDKENLMYIGPGFGTGWNLDVFQWDLIQVKK
jgi:hypothetical protein